MLAFRALPESGLRMGYNKWDSACPELASGMPAYHDVKASRKEILPRMVFYPDGRFASVGRTVYRDNKTQKMQLIPNHGLSVYKGTWKHEGDGTIIITSDAVPDALNARR